MNEQDYAKIRPGMTFRSRDGFHTGKVVDVHAEPPEGTMASGIGFVELEEQLPDRVRTIYLPLTEVMDVTGDAIVVEWDRDIVARHNKQWFPENPVRPS